MNKIEIIYHSDCLICKNIDEEIANKSNILKWDKRSKVFRAPAYLYYELTNYFTKNSINYIDSANNFSFVNLNSNEKIKLRDYQENALDSWINNNFRGVVVMPTGSGKTILAIKAIIKTQSSAIIHVPTIDLMLQWKKNLSETLNTEVGTIGGNTKEILPITVSTYDSAIINMQTIGNKFKLAIFDECHHLPSDQYKFAAEASLAPHRLGLTATPERQDNKDQSLNHLIGKIVYTTHIDELSGNFLSDYKIITIEVELTSKELEDYTENRKVYIDFLKEKNIMMSSARGWQNFIWHSSISQEGRKAFKAYLAQKKISQASKAKHAHIWGIIQKHQGERIIIFTNDNEMAYVIGTKFYLPVITHQTPTKEREDFLNNFRNGTYPILVTSKVLNEGIDIPEANVAIIVSGSGTVREHVQRLGRILRPLPEKKAVFYELISKKTSEYFTNQRRKQHRAYQRVNKN